MSRNCEVCLAAGGAPARSRARRLVLDGRIVALCEAHWVEARAAGVATVAGLRALFPEPVGARSLVPRRAPLDRRIFPPRPEGRRRADGRRSSDTDPAP
ncbi:MAG: hypothetical protein IT376_00605 [Polyangiaceae bacterium]|nr:hypothetical protein [Polyangiaceae bacterium]